MVFYLEDTPEDFSSVEFGLAGGIGYDIDDNFFIEARYTFQINNSYTGSEDVKVIFNAKYEEWLGYHKIRVGVTDMIAETVVA